MRALPFKYLAENALSIVAIAAVVGVVIYWLTHDSNQATRPPPITGTEALDDCSPFESFDDRSMLDFAPRDHSVTYTKEDAPDNKLGVLFAQHPTVSKGTWNIDETTRLVEVDIGPIHLAYHLALPADESYCILVRGSVNSADLTNSYFGVPDFSGDP